MTKADVRKALQQGKRLDEILSFGPGQDCTIFKAEKFSLWDEVIYVPDVELNEIPICIDLSIDNSIRDQHDPKFGPMEARYQIEWVLSYCYTGEEILYVCNDDKALAYRVWCYCDWQHPGTALPECEYEDEEDKKWAEETYASMVRMRDCSTSTETI